VSKNFRSERGQEYLIFWFTRLLINTLNWGGGKEKGKGERDSNREKILEISTIDLKAFFLSSVSMLERKRT